MFIKLWLGPFLDLSTTFDQHDLCLNSIYFLVHSFMLWFGDTIIRVNFLSQLSRTGLITLCHISFDGFTSIKACLFIRIAHFTVLIIHMWYFMLWLIDLPSQLFDSSFMFQNVVDDTCQSVGQASWDVLPSIYVDVSQGIGTDRAIIDARWWRVTGHREDTTTGYALRLFDYLSWGLKPSTTFLTLLHDDLWLASWLVLSTCKHFIPRLWNRKVTFW